MKKWIALVLIGCLCFSLMPTVFATEDKGLEQATISVQSRIDVPEECTEFSSSIGERENGDVIYYFFWRTPKGASEFKYTEVSMNQQGAIIKYRTSSSRSDSIEMRYTSFTRKETIQLAIDWLRKANPDWMKELPEDKIFTFATPSYRTGTDFVDFPRYVNGLSYGEDGVSIHIDNLTGEVVSMEAEWTYLEPAYLPEDTLSKEDLFSAYLRENPLSLSYERKNENEAILVYTIEDLRDVLNARTGKLFEYYQASDASGPLTSNDFSYYMTGPSTGDNSDLPEEPLKKLEEMTDLLSQEELRTIAESIPYTTVSDATFLSIDYSPQKIEGKTCCVATLEYTAPVSRKSAAETAAYTDNEDRFEYTIQIDAQTGALLHYSKYDNGYQDKKDEGEANVVEAEKTANRFSNIYFPEKLEKTKKELDLIYEGEIHFTYTRHENGVPFEYNYYAIDVSNDGKEVIGFYYEWDGDIFFEDPAGLLSLEEAEKALFDLIGIKCSYQLTGIAENKLMDLNATLARTYYYAYYDCMFSATQGIMLDDKGNPWTDEKASAYYVYPADMEGHFAKEAVDKLIATGALEGTEAFRPDEAITQKDMLTYVCGLADDYISHRNDFATLTNIANNANITLFSEDPDAPVTREQAVQMLIEALEYREEAVLESIPPTQFTDEASISEDKKGYVALAKGLKLISGDSEGTFRPLDFATRAEAAMMIHNYLGR